MDRACINPHHASTLDPAVALAISAWTDARYADHVLDDRVQSDVKIDLESYPNPAGDVPGALEEIRCDATSPSVCNTLQCPTGVQACFSQTCPGSTEPGGPGGPSLTIGSCSTNVCPTKFTCNEWPENPGS